LNALQISAGHKKTRAFAETLVAGCLREDSLKECAGRVDSKYQYVDKRGLKKKRRLSRNLHLDLRLDFD